jgi:hypothetical protein
MDNRGQFNRKKIADAVSAGRKSALAALGMAKKTQLTGNLRAAAAVRREFSPKRHVFRREFKQRDRQLTVAYANGVQNVVPAILF